MSTLSSNLDSLWDRLIALGATIQIAPDLEVNGRIFYEKKLILINEPTVRGALLTLAHEGGHYLHYLRNPQLESNRPAAFREELAYLLGWRLLCQVGAVSSHNVSKNDWREWNLIV